MNKKSPEEYIFEFFIDTLELYWYFIGTLLILYNTHVTWETSELIGNFWKHLRKISKFGIMFLYCRHMFRLIGTHHYVIMETLIISCEHSIRSIDDGEPNINDINDTIRSNESMKIVLAIQGSNLYSPLQLLYSPTSCPYAILLLHWENYICISLHIEWDMIVMTDFLLI